MEIIDMNITFPGDTRVNAEMNGIVIPTGGENEPSAFDLFLAGLGTCSGVKVLRFCQERNIATDGVYITQRMHYNAETNHFDRIELEIHLPEDFPSHYRDAVVRAASTCGVKRHLLNPPEIEVYIAVPQPSQPA